MRKWIITAIAVAVLAVGAFLLLKPAEVAEPEKTAQAKCDVTVGYSRLRISTPIFVAQDKGYFKDAGINVCLQAYETAQPMMQALVEGKIDVAGYTALPITFNGMLRSQKKLRFVTAMMEDQDHRISYLLVPEKSSLNAVASLKGKRIGILPTIAYQKWIEAILKRSGIRPTDVVIQQIEPGLQVQALKNGGIDALFTGDPVATAALQGGAARLLTNEVEVPAVMGGPIIFGSFNVSDEWARQNPERYAAIVAALDRAVTFTVSNQAAAKDILRGYLPPNFRPHVAAYPNASYLTSVEAQPELFQKNMELYRQNGTIPQAIDLSGLITSGGKVPIQ